MIRFYFFVFIVAVSAGKCEPDECDDNAAWNECANPCKERSCNYQPSDKPIMCTAVCVRQCTCNHGYVKGPNGQCIQEGHCPPINNCTGQNQFWDECGSVYEEQCEELEDPTSCPSGCVPKCSCTSGHVRGPDGKCILKSHCPSKHFCSDPNAVWNECASGCDQHSCGESDESKICPAVCLRQCVCKPGFVTGPRGNCILKEDCPPKEKCSGQHQFWNECGNGCEPRCDKSHQNRVCPAVCVEKCSCKSGYVIADNGDCVKEEDCSNSCELD